MIDKYLILSYLNEPNKPDKLFCKNTESMERKNNDGTKFIVHCTMENCECLNWVESEKTFLTHSEIMEELKKVNGYEKI